MKDGPRFRLASDRLLVALATFCSLTGCGNSERASNGGDDGSSGAGTGGSGGSVTGGVAGSTAGDAGAGATPSGGGVGGAMAGTAGMAGAGPVSAATACITYATEACHMYRRCLGVDDDPLSEQTCYPESCPDNFFSDGSVRTVESVLACAQSFRDFPCWRLDAGDYPSCAVAGTRAVGETCVFDSQCASNGCTATSGQCGRCATAVGEGMACDGYLTVCEAGLVCIGAMGGATMGTCGELTPPGPAGSPCVVDEQCVEGLSCSSATGACVARHVENESCADGIPCGGGSVCDSMMICRRAPGTNEPCSAFAACPRYTYCNDAGICQPNPGLGEPCTEMLAPDSYRGPCFASRCDATGAPPICVPLPAPGEHCTIPIFLGDSLKGGCRDGARCDCDAPECTVGDPGTCHTVAFEGEACSDPNTRCNSAFECVNGTCQPRATQGLFQRYCGQ